MARQVHRTLRDHFLTLAEDLQEEIADAARLAKDTADRAAVEQDRRRQELQREFDGLVALRHKTRLLTTAATAGVAA